MSSQPTLLFLDTGTGANVPSLDTSSTGQVLSAAFDGSNLRTLVTDQPRPDGIDVCQSSGRMYWTNMGSPLTANNGSVMCANLDGSEVRTLIKPGDAHTPKQIVVDHQASKLYFCDREGLRVHRCDMDGSNHEVIVQTGDWQDEREMMDSLRWCVGIAVDSRAEKFYWTQKGPSKGGKGKIFRANIRTPPGEDAKNRTDIECLFEELPEPIDLEIIPETGMLYWTDRGDFPRGNTLNRGYVGADAPKAVRNDNDVTILAKHFHELIGLKIDTVNQHIYLADLGGSVYRYDLDGQDKEVLLESDSAYTGIALIYDSP